MFKIAPAKTADTGTSPGIPPTMPEATDVEPLKDDSQSGMDLGIDATAKVDQQKSNYLGPESGPFACSNCSFWEEPNACQIVSGKIDPQGICQLFTSLNDGGGEGADLSGIKSPPVEINQAMQGK